MIFTLHGLTLTWRTGAGESEYYELYIGRVYVGNIMKLRLTQGWSMLLASHPNGEEIGLRDTEQEARDGLIDAAVKALFGEEA